MVRTSPFWSGRCFCGHVSRFSGPIAGVFAPEDVLDRINDFETKTGVRPRRIGVYPATMHTLTGSMTLDRAEVAGVEVVRVDTLLEAP